MTRPVRCGLYATATYFGEVLSGEGRTGGDKVGGRALEHDPASIMAGSGAEVDDPVGVGHHCLVVFDHNDRLF